ncbi:hypothetical protein BKI52_27850 [marine bacterium AO1-C]|nr:hypothetical protein BKI52_27850 [marine bacterium AO1-C]
MHNISQQRPLFFSVGLVLSCLMVVTAFEWKMYQKHEAIDLDEWVTVCEFGNVPSMPKAPLVYLGEVVEIQTPVKSAHFEVQEFEEKEDLQIAYLPLTLTPPPPPPVPEVVKLTCGYEHLEEVEEEEEDFICLLPVEEAARPKEGYKAFYKSLMDNFQYPALVEKIGVEGKIFIRFTVEKDGSLTNFEVLKGTDTVLDDEAIRVLKLVPQWIPAKRNGQPIQSRRAIPMIIRLR